MNKQNNQGAALYLVVISTSIAVTLLMIMYSKLSAVAVNAIESIDATQKEFYQESALDMWRSGKTLEEIEELFQEFDWEELDDLEGLLDREELPEEEPEEESEEEPEEEPEEEELPEVEELPEEEKEPEVNDQVEDDKEMKDE